MQECKVLAEASIPGREPNQKKISPKEWYLYPGFGGEVFAQPLPSL